MRQHKHLILMASFFIALIIIGGFLWPKTLEKISASPDVIYATDSTEIDGEYGYYFKWIPGQTTAEPFGMSTTGDCKNTLNSDNNPTYAATDVCTTINDASKKGNIGIRYNNVGSYKGQIIDLKATAIDWENINQNFGQPNSIAASTTYLTLMMSGVENVTWKFDFYLHGTNTQVTVKGYMTLEDLDWNQYFKFKNNAVVDSYLLQGNDWITVSEDKTFRSSAGEVSTYNSNYGLIMSTFEGKSLELVFGETNEGVGSTFWFTSASLGKFTHPNPTKLANKSSVVKGEQFIYKINQLVPYAENYYKTFTITDTFDSNLILPAKESVVITADDGTTVTNKFNINISGQTLTATAIASELQKEEFYAKEYTITVPVKLNLNMPNSNFAATGKYTIKNTANTSRTTTTVESKTTNEVVVEAKAPVIVKYHLVGDAVPNSSALPADENKYVGDKYTASSGLTTTYTGKKCSFKGWYTESSLTNKYESSTLTDDLDLYGAWDCKDPVTIKYHVIGNQPPTELTDRVPQDESKYVDDPYTAKPRLTTTYKDQKCTFNGWYSNTNLTGEKYTNSTLTGNLDLYGAWDCTQLIFKPVKTVDKTTINNTEEFTYTITHNVPAIDDSNFYYTKYEVSDQIDPALKIGEIKVFTSDGTEVTPNFVVTKSQNKVTIVPEELSPSFYNKTYLYKITVNKKENYDLTNYKEGDKYVIPNKATTYVNNTSLDTEIIKVELKQVNINYHIIGQITPPKELTDPVPEGKTVFTGYKYTQEGKITTTYKEKKCTFNGWYTNQEFTTKWQDGNSVNNDLDFYGSWQCDNVVNDINKTTTSEKIVGTNEFTYTIYQTVPELDQNLYYKSYQITDTLESPLEIKDKTKVKVFAGQTEVTNNFDIGIQNQTITITAKNTTSADFYDKEYAYILTVNKKEGADLSKYKKDDIYVIPNKSHLKVTTATNTIEEKDSNEVEKEIKRVTIDYKIVGNTKPDPSKTDQTPNADTIFAGEKYKSANPLTTRYTDKQCTFNGWYTDETLQNKYQDNSVVNDDMTLYGSWNCLEIVSVPPTSSFISRLVIVIAMLLIGGAAYIIYTITKDKKAA
ncbi:MAG: isopeptide-forming domain-containing fimbrial protein [Bacilli bacterium]|nr:isopeptide-forming domain-containing fimbrial protein [Bacilli bacterium]